MDSIFSIDMTWERMWIHMPDSQGALKSEPIVLFLTFFVCCVCFASKTILQSGGSDELGFKIYSGQSRALESCQRNSASAGTYYADAYGPAVGHLLRQG
jgi:hypothetical protein